MGWGSHKHGRLSPLAVRAVARASTTETQRHRENLRICENQGRFPVLEFLCDSVSLWWVLLGTGDRCRFRTAPAPCPTHNRRPPPAAVFCSTEPANLEGVAGTPRRLIGAVGA